MKFSIGPVWLPRKSRKETKTASFFYPIPICSHNFSAKNQEFPNQFLFGSKNMQGKKKFLPPFSDTHSISAASHTCQSNKQIKKYISMIDLLGIKEDNKKEKKSPKNNSNFHNIPDQKNQKKKKDFHFCLDF